MRLTLSTSVSNVVSAQLISRALDDRGVELEVTAVPDDSGRADLTVIHTMPTPLEEPMTDRPSYRVPPGATITDADLDTDPAVVHGHELDEGTAAALAAHTLAQVRLRNLEPGRTSLNGDGSHSPRVQFRVPDAVREQAQERAQHDGVSLSALARTALVHYLAS